MELIATEIDYDIQDFLPQFGGLSFLNTSSRSRFGKQIRKQDPSDNSSEQTEEDSDPNISIENINPNCRPT